MDALLELHTELDFRSHLWPLIAKEAGYGYYRELFTGSPERVSTSWAEFSRRFAALDWYSTAREDLVAASVQDSGHRLDLERLDRPFAGQSFPSHSEVQDAVTKYIEHDLLVRDGPDHPETMALFVALLKVYMDLGWLVLAERLNARSLQTRARLVARLATGYEPQFDIHADPATIKSLAFTKNLPGPPLS